jgi:hypothetical protein
MIINATPHTITILNKAGITQDEKKQFLGNKEAIVVLKEIPAPGFSRGSKCPTNPQNPLTVSQ